MPQKLIRGLCACVLVLFAQCSRNTLDVAGGGSDTEVSGRIVSADGVGNSGVCVMLIEATYIPAFESTLSPIKFDTTDSNGKYHFTHVNTGVYNVQAQHTANLTRYLLPAINVSGNTAVTVADDSLRTPATLRVFLPDSISLLSGYLYVPGTRISKYFSAGSITVEFDSIPQGLLPSIQYKNNASSVEQSLFGNVLVDSSGTTVLHSANSWTQTSRIFFNTTPNGANVSGNVYGFPMLLRLTSSTFDFSKTNVDGSDIRFAKANGSPLPYEIEQWDLAAKQAAIWVKIDTIFGNDNSHYVNMFWGNPNAKSESKSSGVFDTSNGFQGVWHMNETGTGQAKDATQNHYDGTPSAHAPVATPGIIGMAQKFDADSSFIMMNGTASGKLNFPINGNYTVSAWVNLDSLLGIYKVFISKGYTQYTLQINNRNSFEISEFHEGLGWEYTPGSAVANTWKYVVGVREGTNQYLYIDGVLASSTIINDSSSTPRVTTDQLIMGAASGGTRDFLNGSMDELSISSVSRKSDWIKLCYMNQCANDKLLQIK